MTKQQYHISDLQMIKSPDEWPMWPTLPLKRYINGSEWQGGFLFATEDKEKYPNEKIVPRVLLGNIWAIRDVMKDATSNAEFYERYKTIDYDSLEAILADGWVVD